MLAEPRERYVIANFFFTSRDEIVSRFASRVLENIL